MASSGVTVWKMDSRMKRASTLLLAFWATAIAPSLCLAGVLTHPCEPHASQDCRHEPACVEDPCGQILKIQHDPRTDSPQLVISDIPRGFLVESDLPLESHRTDEVEPPRKPHLPFPSSDIPLRV